MNYSKKEKLSLLSDMIQLAKSDKKLKESELSFIMAVAKNLKITSNEIYNLIDKPAEKVTLKTEADRILHFHRLLLVANIDKETSITEITALKNFGLHMGLPVEAINEVFTKMGDYPNKIIPPDVVFNIFKRFYN